jgi:hypothetical protein
MGTILQAEPINYKKAGDIIVASQQQNPFLQGTSLKSTTLDLQSPYLVA